MLTGKGVRLMHSGVDNVIDAEARHRIGTDHALLSSRVILQCKDRPNGEMIPDLDLLCATYRMSHWLMYDISALAKTHTKPLPGMRYRDPPEVLQAIELAKPGNDNRQWREVHKQRKNHGNCGRMKGSARFYT